MPWHIVADSASCSASRPYAVVKDADGSVEGCHATAEAAKDQLAALYASEENTMTYPVTVRADEPNLDTPDAGNLNAAARREAARRGWAMDDGSYPIRPLDMHGRADLEKAIRAVGRGGGSHDAIRRHIIKRARSLGLTELIPNNWNSDGNLKEQASLGGDPMSDVERRYTSDVATTRNVDGRRTIGGYAAKFDRYSDNLGGFIERVAPTFFNKSRGDGWPDVVARYNHDDNMLLGTTGAATLRLHIDDVGLSYDVDPPASRADIIELVERGDVRKSSFAFHVIEDDWSVNDLGNTVRTLESGMLVDVAPVNRPAYRDTSIGPRSATAAPALRSLATKVSADVEDVVAAAEVGELRRLLVVESDAPMPKAKPKPRLSGQKAVATLLASKQDPWTDAPTS